MSLKKRTNYYIHLKKHKNITIEQTKTSPQETLELKLTKSYGISALNPPISLEENKIQVL